MNINPFENKFNNTGPEQEYFKETVGSKEYLSAKKMVDIIKKAQLKTIGTDENILAITTLIEQKMSRLIPGSDISGIIQELKNSGFITEPVQEKKPKVVIQPEHIETERITLQGAKKIELTAEENELKEANLLLDEINRKNIFKNSNELDNLYTRIILENKDSSETVDYYHEFESVIKGGKQEIQKDFDKLQERKELFKQKNDIHSPNYKKIENAKKIATLTECAVATGVSQLKWFGEKVSIVRASEFDDVMHGIDDLLEIKKDSDESDFLGLGIDVTFRGLESEEFKQKFFKLLQSIFDGYQPTIKYLKDDQGNCKKEFKVPKMVLYFNVDDVRDMIEILRNIGISSEQDSLQNSPQRKNIMNQIIHSCKKLAKFAEECKKPIFRKYYTVINSLKELSFNDAQIDEMINIDHSDKVSEKLDQLIEEFKLLKSLEHTRTESSDYGN